ncbi:type II toxin-antitoxin system RelE/ParE family toxin [bacterium]|nr:type II toxin-antitoxin system RelE/ParE family toxin [bacterium]
MKEIIYYQTAENKVPYLEWYNSLDKSLRLIVDKRLSKVERGLYGNNKRLSEELYELKFDNGLRIYYTEIENTIVLLFTGGNKSKQSKDIETATKYLNEYNSRF